MSAVQGGFLAASLGALSGDLRICPHFASNCFSILGSARRAIKPAPLDSRRPCAQSNVLRFPPVVRAAPQTRRQGFAIVPIERADRRLRFHDFTRRARTSHARPAAREAMRGHPAGARVARVAQMTMTLMSLRRRPARPPCRWPEVARHGDAPQKPAADADAALMPRRCRSQTPLYPPGCILVDRRRTQDDARQRLPQLRRLREEEEA